MSSVCFNQDCAICLSKKCHNSFDTSCFHQFCDSCVQNYLTSFYSNPDHYVLEIPSCPLCRQLCSKLNTYFSNAEKKKLREANCKHTFCELCIAIFADNRTKEMFMECEKCAKKVIIFKSNKIEKSAYITPLFYKRYAALYESDKMEYINMLITV